MTDHLTHDKEDAPMTAWTSDELDKIGAADELELAPRSRDGTLRHPVTIWVVRVDDDFYIRAYKGRASAWFRGSQVCHAGRVTAGGVTKEVTFEDVGNNQALNDQIDAAYRSKYQRYGAAYVDPMVTPPARATTMKLVPRSSAE